MRKEEISLRENLERCVEGMRKDEEELRNDLKCLRQELTDSETTRHELQKEVTNLRQESEQLRKQASAAAEKSENKDSHALHLLRTKFQVCVYYKIIAVCIGYLYNSPTPI